MAQEADGTSEMSYELSLPSYFIYANKAELDSGTSTICIVGGSAVRTGFGQPDTVFIPPRANIHFVNRPVEPNRRLLVNGTQAVLVVVVTAPSSLQSVTPARAADVNFGTGGQQYNMMKQFNSCSFGKLNFVAATGFPSVLTNGVIEISLPQSVYNTTSTGLENTMIDATKAKLGVDDLKTHFSKVMFCMPYGSLSSSRNMNWVAYSYRPGSYSFFNNGKCCVSTIPMVC